MQIFDLIQANPLIWILFIVYLVATSALVRSLSFQARAAHPCIGEQRADLVVAGCAIVEAVLTLWPLSRLRVADRGLREGMLTRMIEQDLAGPLTP